MTYRITCHLEYISSKRVKIQAYLYIFMRKVKKSSDKRGDIEVTDFQEPIRAKTGEGFGRGT